MSDLWRPELRLRTRAGRCRLTLVNVVSGEGASLQEAANDLVARLFDLAASLRSSGFRFSAGTGRPDPRVLTFLWEAGELLRQGGDLRQWVFGPAGAPPESR